MTMYDKLVIAICCVGVFLLVRNHVVYKIRMSFINDDELWQSAYRRLPSYDAMVMNPKHWLKWSKGHWIEYATLEAA
jgi:hypothetical protein